MLTIDNIETFNFEGALRGLRNPLNSWAKSDSHFVNGELEIGPNDMILAKKMVSAGTDESKFLRQIFITMDITAPLYWWKEFDTYKVGTVSNSCSTMHKIAEKEFTINDFSHEHILTRTDKVDEESVGICPWMSDAYYGEWSPEEVFETIIEMLNACRQKYIETKNKRYWWQMIQLLPSSYNQKRTITLNYQVARAMYFARKNHKLDEWHTFCDILENLPYGKDFICYKK